MREVLRLFGRASAGSPSILLMTFFLALFKELAVVTFKGEERRSSREEGT